MCVCTTFSPSLSSCCVYLQPVKLSHLVSYNLRCIIVLIVFMYTNIIMFMCSNPHYYYLCVCLCVCLSWGVNYIYYLFLTFLIILYLLTGYNCHHGMIYFVMLLENRTNLFFS